MTATRIGVSVASQEIHWSCLASSESNYRGNADYEAGVDNGQCTA